MIELLNGLQNGKGGEGLDKLMANSSSKNPLEAQQFQELLSKAQTSDKPEQSLKNLLSQKQQSAKEIQVLSSSDELAQKLLAQGSGEEVSEQVLEQSTEQLAGEQMMSQVRPETGRDPILSLVNGSANSKNQVP